MPRIQRATGESYWSDPFSNVTHNPIPDDRSNTLHVPSSLHICLPASHQTNDTPSPKRPSHPRDMKALRQKGGKTKAQNIRSAVLPSPGRGSLSSQRPRNLNSACQRALCLTSAKPGCTSRVTHPQHQGNLTMHLADAKNKRG